MGFFEGIKRKALLARTKSEIRKQESLKQEIGTIKTRIATEDLREQKARLLKKTSGGKAKGKALKMLKTYATNFAENNKRDMGKMKTPFDNNKGGLF